MGLMKAAAAPPSARTLKDFLVPGMLNLTVEKALATLNERCYAMQESQVLAQRVFNRVLFLRQQVEHTPIGARIQSDVILRYGELVGHVLQSFGKYSSKTLVARIAANRRFLEDVEAIHKRLDVFFKKVNLAGRVEMTEWQTYWEQDLDQQQSLLASFLTNKLVMNNELTERKLEEALTEMKFELTVAQKTQKQIELMDSVETYFRFHHKMFNKAVPAWFVARDELQYKQEPFAIGTYGAVFRGTLERTKAKVVIKSMYSDSKQTQEAIYAEGELWYRLDHPSVLKMKGGCYVGSPMFLLCEDAGDRRNFSDFFSDSEKNKQKMWHLFLEAAEGLSYLHKKGIVHNNLKCSNLLVGVDGRAKLCDFGFSYDTNDPTITSPKKHTTAARWKAPELLSNGDVFPSFASDIYSLGMCIIEAATGALPWGQATPDQVIVEKATTKQMHVRPTELNEMQWELVKAMCEAEPSERVTLAQAMKQLRGVIHASEGRAVESTKACGKCESANPTKNKFCNECGNRFPEESIAG
ncbi:DNA polymerase alpha-associated dna helicase a [Globisporangium polare]